MDRPKKFNVATLVRISYLQVVDSGTKPFEVLNNALDCARHRQTAIY